MARIAIIGASGAIGGVIASLLQTTGKHELVLCVRTPIDRIVVQTPEGEVALNGTLLTRPEDATPVDWVMIATKAYDVDSAAQWLENLGAGAAPVAVLQNCVEHRERFAPYIAHERILPVMVDCPVERQPTQNGVARLVQRSTMILRVEDETLGHEFVGLFAGSTADVVAVEDWLTVAWKKLANNAVGALPALVLKPAGVLHDEALGEVALDIVRECIAVGRAEGANLPDALAEDTLAACRRALPDSINSLHADRLAGRPIEIDARNGAIVRKGKTHGIPTPANSMAVALLKAMTAK